MLEALNTSGDTSTPASLTGKRILILATNGFEQSELEKPCDGLKAIRTATFHRVAR